MTAHTERLVPGVAAITRTPRYTGEPDRLHRQGCYCQQAKKEKQKHGPAISSHEPVHGRNLLVHMVFVPMWLTAALFTGAEPKRMVTEWPTRGITVEGARSCEILPVMALLVL